MGSVSDNNKFVGHTNLATGVVELLHNHHHAAKDVDITSKPVTDADLTALFRYCDNNRLFVKTLRGISPETTEQQADDDLAYFAKFFQRLKRAVKRAAL